MGGALGMTDYLETFQTEGRMNQIRYETDAEGIVTLTFDSPDGPVNTMSQAWQQDFIACVERAIAEKDKLRGVILASAKASFFAGADLKSVLRLTEKDAPEVYRNIEAMKAALRKLELSGAFASTTRKSSSAAPR